MKPGVYIGTPAAEYHDDTAGLSNSGMKVLAIDPLNYWHSYINPNRSASKETAAMRLGTATHCRIIESEKFAQSYVSELRREDYPEALVTVADMQKWLAEKGLPKTGKLKADVADKVRAADPNAPIWDDLIALHEQRNRGKIILSREESELIEGMASAVDGLSALAGGIAEVSFVVKDPDTGVLIKSRMDLIREDFTADLKTFYIGHAGEPVDKVINRAIWREAYHHQAVLYHKVRELARIGLGEGTIEIHGGTELEVARLRKMLLRPNHGFRFVFVNNDPPFNVRVISLRRGDPQPNAYWLEAEGFIYDMLQLFRQCSEEFGESPWRKKIVTRPLRDEDLPQLAWAA